jgi:hypothetical protein
MNIQSQRPFFSIILFLAFLLGLYFLSEAIANHSNSKSPLEHGTVIRVEKAEIFWGVKRPLLIVRADKSAVELKALLSASVASNIPRRVSFHYSGNPAEEIYLEQEYDPLWIGLFFVGSTFVCITLAAFGVISDPVMAAIFRNMNPYN